MLVYSDVFIFVDGLLYQNFIYILLFFQGHNQLCWQELLLSPYVLPQTSSWLILWILQVVIFAVSHFPEFGHIFCTFYQKNSFLLLNFWFEVYFGLCWVYNVVLFLLFFVMCVECFSICCFLHYTWYHYLFVCIWWLIVLFFSVACCCLWLVYIIFLIFLTFSESLCC